MRVLWLASWYPNKYEPVNGDFIQRHAKAVSKFMPINVLHVVQTGKDSIIEEGFTENIAPNLHERIYGFTFKKLGIGFIDKIRYNLAYKAFYLNLIDEYTYKFGKPDLIHVHVPMKAGIVALAINKKLGIPYIVSEQASHYEPAAPDSFYKRSFFFRWNTKKVFQQAAIVTNVSATLGVTLQQLFGLKKVIPVHNLADKNIFFYKPLASKKVFRWLHVSALNSQKNIEGMIEAFALLHQQNNQEHELVIAGPFNDSHLAMVKEKNIENKVTFIGEIDHEQVAIEMQQSNAFVLFSKHENFPCVIVEALCCGLPVVAANVGGVAEAVDKSNGIIVPSENVTELAHALNEVMKSYENFDRKSISTNALAKYDVDVIGKQFVSLYEKLLLN